jgi:hypothetical protein
MQKHVASVQFLAAQHTGETTLDQSLSCHDTSNRFCSLVMVMSTKKAMTLGRLSTLSLQRSARILLKN